MKNFKQRLLLCLCSIMIVLGSFFMSACLQMEESVSINSIEKTSSVGLVDTYTIYYSDGTSYQFSITNGADGKDGLNGTNGADGKDGSNGIDGEDGADGKDATFSIQDIYDKYVADYENISYADFLETYLNINITDNSLIINRCLLSCMSLCVEFTYTGSHYDEDGNYVNGKYVNFAFGSAVIYKIENDYTYVVTNYHVVYDNGTNTDCADGIAYNIHGYLYGSVGYPASTESLDDKGYKVYDYGNYGIELEYVGGSIDHDIAILRVPTDDIKDVNSDIKAVELSDGYHVGQTAIAIGNPEAEGISATEGIISVCDEYIALDIDGETRYYRSLRIDTSIYAGSSGGGLFNNRGELIGITNAGMPEDQNINYAVPIEIVKSVVDNILYNYDGTTPATIHKPHLGVVVEAYNSRYVYDAETGYGIIKEDVVIKEVVEDSIFDILGLQTGDVITNLMINDITYDISRTFHLGEPILQIKVGDMLSIKYTRDSFSSVTESYQIKVENII